MKTEKFGNLIGITKGKKHLETDDVNASRYLQIDDVNGDDNHKYTHEKGVHVNANDIVLVWDGANAGKVGIGLQGNIGSTLSRIKLDTAIAFPKYVYWFLQSKFNFIKSQRTGATIPHVSQSSIRELSIPISPLPEQRRIANILDHADSIRRKNRQILEKYNELAQSVFYEMFGDPVKNEKEWEKYKLSKIIKKLDTGKSFASVEDLNSGDYKVLKTSSVSWGSFKKNEYKSLPTKYIPPHNHLIKKGDILMSRMNTTELVGASTYVFEEVKGLALPDRIWKFVFNELIPTDSIFIWYSINTKSFRSEISKISSGTSGSMKNISKEKVLNLSTIIPPIKFQKKFAEIIENIELQKRLSQNSLDKCEILFQSLLQKAFKGEL